MLKILTWHICRHLSSQ